jgi:hypothetical protein
MSVQVGTKHTTGAYSMWELNLQEGKSVGFVDGDVTVCMVIIPSAVDVVS